MRYLLDTHALIWFLEGDSSLSETAKALITDGKNELAVSIASIWEIAIKVSIGKLSLSQPFDNIFPSELKKQHIQVLPLKITHTSQVKNLPLHHRDPFDRLIIAQAMIEGMPVITVDKCFNDYDVGIIW